MKPKVLLVLSLISIALIALFAVQLIIYYLSPGLATTFGILRFVWLWWLVDVLGYVVAIVTLVLSGVLIGRFIERKVPADLDALRASMVSTAAAVIGGVVLIFGLVSYVLDVELAAGLGAMAFLFAVVPAAVSWLLSPYLVNLFYGCRYDPEIQKVVNEVAERAGMKPPKAMRSPVNIPNAFAYSSPIAGRYVAVTDGLLRTLKGKDELKAVVGHELGHHKHRDNTVMMLFGILPTAIYYMGRMLLYVGLFSSRYSDGSRRREGGSGLVVAALGGALMAISILIQIGVLALSRLREFYADAHGAKVTSPLSMISALKSLDGFYRRYGKEVIANSKLKTLFIYAFTEPFVGLEELLSTHPPIWKRVAFLETLVGREIRA
ncbi:MAG: zinc metalloprotease HtpX [Sulfolobales archaeon]|nr:M48 family metalloprotease [Sulfolobales archaeon]MCX8208739.1 M48 family metalloprotease [Sulfolobales archaeon]MDW8010296.1 zinc metalloprotease HtpX [Sulfolobales archaeon]